MLKELDPNLEFKKITEELRNYVVFRDNGLCQICGKSGSEIHHIKYRSHLGKNFANNLITLCTLCHTGKTGVHGIKEKGIFEILTLKVKRNERKFRELMI